MADENKETRDRVRALVRQVLATVPTEDEAGPSATGAVAAVEHVVVNSLQDKIGREFDRDESSKSLLTEDQGIVRPLLQKIGVKIGQLEGMVESELNRLPKVSGGVGQVGAGQAVMQVFDAATQAADQMKDQFVSTEHLLLG